jgi:uncharacterized membrane protein
MKARYLWIIYFIASLVILSAVSRLIGVSEFLLTGKSADSGDQHYASHLVVTLLHLIPGLLFILLGPLQFVSSIRNRWPQYHRWMGRVLLFCGLFTAISALIMNFTFPPVGGTAKAIAVVIFSVFTIVALIVAWYAAVNRQFTKHRDWIIRAYAILLAVSTARFFFVPYFLIAGMPTVGVIDLGMCSAFLLNWIVAEMIIRRLHASPIKRKL